MSREGFPKLIHIPTKDSTYRKLCDKVTVLNIEKPTNLKNYIERILVEHVKDPGTGESKLIKASFPAGTPFTIDGNAYSYSGISYDIGEHKHSLLVIAEREEAFTKIESLLYKTEILEIGWNKIYNKTQM